MMEEVAQEISKLTLVVSLDGLALIIILAYIAWKIGH